MKEQGNFHLPYVHFVVILCDAFVICEDQLNYLSDPDLYRSPCRCRLMLLFNRCFFVVPTTPVEYCIVKHPSLSCTVLCHIHHRWQFIEARGT